VAKLIAERFAKKDKPEMILVVMDQKLTPAEKRRSRMMPQWEKKKKKKMQGWHMDECNDGGANKQIFLGGCTLVSVLCWAKKRVTFVYLVNLVEKKWFCSLLWYGTKEKLEEIKDEINNKHWRLSRRIFCKSGWVFCTTNPFDSNSAQGTD
jgi:hypothetical protein